MEGRSNKGRRKEGGWEEEGRRKADGARYERLGGDTGIVDVKNEDRLRALEGRE